MTEKNMRKNGVEREKEKRTHTVKWTHIQY